jgi:hypothetical protein
MTEHFDMMLAAAFGFLALAKAEGANVGSTHFREIADRAITYAVSLTVGKFKLHGTITTDGTIGSLKTSNIRDFDLFIDGLEDAIELNARNSTVRDSAANHPSHPPQSDWAATSTTLSFDFGDSSHPEYLQFHFNSTKVDRYWPEVTFSNSNCVPYHCSNGSIVVFVTKNSAGVGGRVEREERKMDSLALIGAARP